jgi:two-component system response regulator
LLIVPTSFRQASGKAQFLLKLRTTMSTRASILLIDDSPVECELFHSAVNASGIRLSSHTASNGQAAMKYLEQAYQARALPALILLDLNLGREQGVEILRRLRADRHLAHLPVIIFTTSDAAVDLAAGYRSGANGYVVKPETFDRLIEFILDLHRYWIGWNRTLHESDVGC